MGGKTGLYLVGFNRKDGIKGKRDTALTLNASDFRGINRNQTQNAVFVDLCKGQPEQTEIARCLTARYGQTTLSNHRAERSGVLMIRGPSKKGYTEAVSGNSFLVSLLGGITDQQHSGALCPVVGEGGLPIPGGEAPRRAGDSRLSGAQIHKSGIGRYQIQSGFTAHAASSRRLGTRYACRVVDS